MVPSSRDVLALQIDVQRSLARMAREDERVAAEVAQWEKYFRGSYLSEVWGNGNWVVVAGPGEGDNVVRVGIGDRVIEPTVFRIEPEYHAATEQRIIGRVYQWVFGQPGCESGKPGTWHWPPRV